MRSLLKASLVAGAAVLVSSGAAQAATIEVKVPFPFVVEGQTLPAGQYRVEVDGPLATIRPEKSKASTVFLMTLPANGHDPSGETPALTFSHEHGQYRLDDIWSAKNDGAEVPHR